MILVRRKDALAAGVSDYMWRQARKRRILQAAPASWRMERPLYMASAVEKAFGLPAGTLGKGNPT